MKCRLFICALFLLVAGGSAFSQTAAKFDFGGGKTEKGFTKVSAEDLYNEEKGFGFEPNQTIDCLDRNDKNALRSDFCTAAEPFYFSVKLPEGNYRVKITFGDKNETTETTVKAELRRLMIESVETGKGNFATREFVVNVRRPQIATGGEVKLKDREKTMEWRAWDEKLTLEFNGARPAVNAIEIEKVETIPTLFILGDSTVCDQPREPYASWGQMLTRFLSPQIAVANHAESGESLRSSTGARRLDKVLSLMKPNDFLLIQYGHNDEKEKGEGVGAFTTYRESLKKFVAEARKKGGVPILVTPVHRRTFDDAGKIVNSHGDYPEAVRRVAREEKVAMIDLTEMSRDFYEALGGEKSAAAFKEGDGTHHNNYGAYELAKMIASAIKKQKLSLAKYLIQDLPNFDPKKPYSVESFRLPPSPLITDLKPLGN